MAELNRLCTDIDRNINIGNAFEVDNPEDCGGILGKKTDTLRIFAQNIRSINKNFDGLLVLLERIKIKHDIILLTECWLSKTNLIPIIPGYNSFHTTQHYNQNDGVIIYVKDSFKNVKVIEPCDSEDLNCLVVILNDISVIGIYRPCEFKNTDKFITSLDKILTKFKNNNLILMGDINIDIKIGIDTNSSRDYLELLALHGLIQSHNLLTTKKSCLDHCFIKSNMPVNTIIYNSSLTDHFSVITEISKCIIAKDSNKRSYSKTDYNALLKHFEGFDWEERFNKKDPNEATEIFMGIIIEAFKKFTAVEMTSCRKTITKPWITPGLLKCMRHRDRLHKKLRSDPDNVILNISYKRYRHTCNNILKTLKNEYYKKKLNKCKNNLKDRWKTIKEICHMDKLNDMSRHILNIKDTNTSSVNHVNSYFSNVGKSLAAKILNKNITTEKSLTKIIQRNFCHSNSFVLLPVNEQEVKSVINSLKSSSSFGWDGISSNSLKILVSAITRPITLLCNLCFTHGVFPDLFKKSIIIPIYKSGEKNILSNYRPISLLPTLAKVIEKLLNSRLKSYIEKYKILAKNQYGFRSNRSTSDAITKLLSFITKHLDESEKVTGIFLDLEKAFDTVSYPLLFKKLENIGIRETPLKLFKNYMTNRKQCVKIAEHMSEEINIEYGVPQGSVLGPTLFLIYLNDLCHLSLQNGEVITFADDTVLLFHGKTWEETNKHANDGFSTIAEWLDNNLLTLNIKKTRYINFSMRTNTLPEQNQAIIKLYSTRIGPEQNFNFETIVEAKCIKYLGVNIDCHLNWKEHIILLTSRVRRLIYIFKTLRYICDSKLLLDTYFALCNPLISYAIEAWGGTYKNNIIMIERAQRAVLKVMNFKHFRYPTALLYQENPVLSVRQMFIKQIIIRQHVQPIDENNLSKRRKDRVYRIPQIKTAFCKRFFFYLGPFIYNEISKEITLRNLSLYSLKPIIYNYLKVLTPERTEVLIKKI